MSYSWFNRQELFQKAKDRYHNCGGKQKLLSTILKTGEFFLKKQKISIKACQKKKKKKKENMERTDTEK